MDMAQRQMQWSDTTDPRRQDRRRGVSLGWVLVFSLALQLGSFLKTVTPGDGDGGVASTVMEESGGRARSSLASPWDLPAPADATAPATERDEAIGESP